MFAAVQRLQALALPIHGTVAEPFPNAVGAQASASAAPNYAPDMREMGGQKDGEFLLKTCGPGGADMVWCYGTPDPIY